MRIVAVADTHLYTDELVVPEGDVFVHAGDLCRRGALSELEAAVRWLAGLPHRYKVVVAGNHDWPFMREPAAARALLRDAIYLQDEEAIVEGLRIYGTPWQPAYNAWAFNVPRGQLAALWERIPAGLDVLITHGPPFGIGDGQDRRSGRAGCVALRARVLEVAPRVHLFGHIHAGGGAWQQGSTLFANVTTWECTRAPTVLDIDAESVRVVYSPPDGRVR